MSIRAAFGFMVFLYVLNWFLDQTIDIYGMIPDFDIPMHFAGGFAAGLLAIAIHHDTTTKRHLKNVPWYYHAGFVLGMVALIAVVWELHEFVLDWVHEQRGGGGELMQPSVADTMADLLFGMCGGGIAYGVFKNKQ